MIAVAYLVRTQHVLSIELVTQKLASPFQVLPVIKNFFTLAVVFSFIFIAHFLWACVTPGMNPGIYI